jgi:hypothetical protein
MFRLARRAALLVVALSLTPGRANDPGSSFGGQGAQSSFSLEGQLYERLRLTGAATFAGFELRAKRTQGGLALDVTITRRNAAGEVIWRAEAATMELRSDRGGKRLLARMKDVAMHGSDGTSAVMADRVFEIERPGRP